MYVFLKNNVKFNPIYLKIECGELKWIFLWEMDSACPEDHATERSDSDHSTKVECTTLGRR